MKKNQARFIVDRVLLNADLDAAMRMRRLQKAGAAFLAVIVISSGSPIANWASTSAMRSSDEWRDRAWG